MNHREIGTGTGYGMSSAGSVVLDFASVCTGVVRSSPTTTFFAPIEQTLFHLFRRRRTRWGWSVSPRWALLRSSGVPVAAPRVTSALRVGSSLVATMLVRGQGLAWFGGTGVG